MHRVTGEGLGGPNGGAPAPVAAPSVADHPSPSALPVEEGQLHAASGAGEGAGSQKEKNTIAPDPQEPDLVLTLSVCVRAAPTVITDRKIDLRDQPRQPEIPHDVSDPAWAAGMIPPYRKLYHEMSEGDTGPGALPELCISHWGVLLDPPHELVSRPGKIFPDYAPAILIEEEDLWHLLRENLERARQQPERYTIVQTHQFQPLPTDLDPGELDPGGGAIHYRTGTLGPGGRMGPRHDPPGSCTAAQALAGHCLSYVLDICLRECYVCRYPLEPFHPHFFGKYGNGGPFPHEVQGFRSLSQADKRTHIEQHVERIRFAQCRFKKVFDLFSVELDARFRKEMFSPVDKLIKDLSRFQALHDEGLCNLLWQRYEARVNPSAQSEALDAYESRSGGRIPTLIVQEKESGGEELGGNDGDDHGLSAEEEGHGGNDGGDHGLSAEEEGHGGKNSGLGRKRADKDISNWFQTSYRPVTDQLQTSYRSVTDQIHPHTLTRCTAAM